MSKTPVVLLVLATIGFVIALVVGAPSTGVSERVYAAVGGLLVVLLLVRGLELWARSKDDDPAGLEAADDRMIDPGAARTLELGRALRLGELSAGDFDSLVRPRLVALVRARRGPLPPGTDIALLVPGNERLRDRAGPGVGLDEVEAIVSALESEPQ